MAGNAITASPSQFGATMTMRSSVAMAVVFCLLPSAFCLVVVFVTGFRKHPRRLRRRRIAPAAMHPQPQIRTAPHLHLEHVGAALREFADRAVSRFLRRRDRRFVN